MTNEQAIAVVSVGLDILQNPILYLYINMYILRIYTLFIVFIYVNILFLHMLSVVLPDIDWNLIKINFCKQYMPS